MVMVGTVVLCVLVWIATNLAVLAFALLRAHISLSRRAVNEIVRNCSQRVLLMRSANCFPRRSNGDYRSRLCRGSPRGVAVS